MDVGGRHSREKDWRERQAVLRAWEVGGRVDCERVYPSKEDEAEVLSRNVVVEFRDGCE